MITFAISFILEKINIHTRIWLGIELSNIKTAEFYTKLGFINPQLTNSTPGMLNIGKSIISLEYMGIIPNSAKSDALIVANKLAYNAHLEVTRLTTQIIKQEKLEYKVFKLLISDLFRLQKYLNDPIEYGGSFIRTNGNNGNILGLSPQIYKGSETNFTVLVPYSEFSFHTHPTLAYVKYYSALGWPSIQDIVRSSCDNSERFHMIVTVEGLYIIELTGLYKEFILFLVTQYGHEYIEILKLAIVSRFSIEHLRNIDNVCPQLARRLKPYKSSQRIKNVTVKNSLMNFSSEKDTIIARFLNYANTTNINMFVDIDSRLKSSRDSFIRKVGVSDFTVYRFSFIRWQYINRQDQHLNYFAYKN
jgi:hypothetical protein